MQLNAKLIRYFLRAKYRSSGGVSVLGVPIVYLMCPLTAAQMGTTSTQQVEETQAAFAQGSIFTEYLSCATSHSEVLQQCLGNYTIRSTWKTETLDG